MLNKYDEFVDDLRSRRTSKVKKKARKAEPPKPIDPRQEIIDTSAMADARRRYKGRYL